MTAESFIMINVPPLLPAHHLVFLSDRFSHLSFFDPQDAALPNVKLPEFHYFDPIPYRPCPSIERMYIIVSCLAVRKF